MLGSLRTFFGGDRGIGTRKTKASFRPSVDHLEDRSLLSVTLLANDNWVVQKDNDHSGTLSLGDTVNNKADKGAVRVTGTYGVNAFGSVSDAVAAAEDGD